jgi:hypothetical protein
MNATRTFGWLSAAVLSAAVAGATAPAWAQENPGNTPPAGQQDQANPRGGQRGNMEQFRQRMEQRLKEQLGVSDEEFKALQPKIETVGQLQRELNARGGMMGGRRGRGGQAGPGGPNANAPTGPVATAREDLRKTLDNKSASADEIKAKLTALRDAETKAQGDLDKARQELKDLLTQRQEAVLVMDGVLK